jgi:hypothetical protein
MGYTLNLEISEELYQSLRQTAQESGQTVEALVMQWLANNLAKVQEDPLEQWIGSFTSNVPDWTEKVDEYLGQQQLLGTEQQLDKEGAYA